jgi:hypothetical protein
MIRPICGSVPGALAHQAAGEPVCGWCSWAEKARRIEAEGIPSRVPPPPESDVRPVSDVDAAMHALVLRRELAAFEKAHPGCDWRADGLGGEPAESAGEPAA